jgi:hypothetical protein
VPPGRSLLAVALAQQAGLPVGALDGDLTADAKRLGKFVVQEFFQFLDAHF